MVNASPADIATLLELSLPVVQVRYRFDNREWWDTLCPAGANWRLVRVEHADLPG